MSSSLRSVSELPVGSSPPVDLILAISDQSAHAEEARGFADFCASPPAQEIISHYRVAPVTRP